LTVWARPDEADGLGIVLRAIEEYGTTNVGLPEGPPFFRFSDHGEFRRSLEAAGFADVEFRELPLEWRLTSAEAVFDAMTRGGVRTSALLKAQTPDAIARIRDYVRMAVDAYAGAGEYVLPMPAVLASATRL